MRNSLKNENGSSALLTIITLAIVGIMLIFIVNIVMAYAKKEQSLIAAEQASFAASSVVFDELDIVVSTYIKYIYDSEGNLIAEEPLSEKVNKAENSILSSQPMLSQNEAHFEAVNTVLKSEIPTDDKLRPIVYQAIKDAQTTIPSVVEDIIKKNHANEDKTKVYYFNEENRIEVETVTEFNAFEENPNDYGDEEDIKQIGYGPKFSFITSLNWTNIPLYIHNTENNYSWQ